MESVWYQTKGSSTKNQPRRLLPNEIDYLLNNLPTVECGDSDARRVANDSIRKFLREQLTDVFLEPDSLEDFKDKIISSFEQARVAEGESAGDLTADALGESSTQVALNTFHVGGAATAVLVGIEGLKSLIFAYQPKNKSTVIHLTNPTRNFDETLDMRKYLEGVSIGDLIDGVNFEIDTFENLGRPDWYVYNEMIFDDIVIEPNTMVMRINLKLDRLLYFEITMDELHQAITEAAYGEYDEPIVDIIYSPLPIATIDLILAKGKIQTENPSLQRFAEISFFRNTVIPVFNTLYIRGIATVDKVYPVSSAVWEKSFSIVRSMYDSEKEKLENIFPEPHNARIFTHNTWVVELNTRSMRNSGIQNKELYELLKSLGLVYVRSKDILYVHNPNKTTQKEESLSTFIRERKNGMPFIKDSNILDVKVNKYVKYSDIRLYDYKGAYYITYDLKYIKYVLSYLKNQGFSWNRNSEDSIMLWKYVDTNSQDGKPIEVLSYEDPDVETARQVKAYKLTQMPNWLTPELSPDDLSHRLSNYYKYDLKRVFVYSDKDNIYIYYHPDYKAELVFHLHKSGFELGDAVRFKFNVERTENVSIRRMRDISNANLDYMKVDPRYRERVSELIEEKGLEWGNEIPYTVKIEKGYNVVYTPSEKGNIELYPLVIPQDVNDDISVKLEESGELDNESLDHYRKGNFDAIHEDEMRELNNLIADHISSHIRKKSSANPYDHWFLTSKDRADKKFSVYDTLSNPLIDTTLTYNNSLNELSAVLGVEAAYSYFIKALKDLNESGGNYIDPRHILLIADFIFSRGKPNGVLFAGLSRQPIGHIALITVERAMEVLRKLAFTKSTENVNSVSVAISTGQIGPLGTGGFIFSDDPKTQRQILNFNKNIDNIRLDQDEMSDAIKDLNKEAFGGYEPDKLIPELPSKYETGKTYDYFNDLFGDVIAETEVGDEYGIKAYPMSILPLPPFEIKHMNMPDAVSELLIGEVQPLIKKSVIKEVRKAVVVDPSKTKKRKKKALSPAKGSTGPSTKPEIKPATTPSTTGALPVLNMEVVLTPDVKPDVMNVEAYDIEAFEKGI